MEIRKSVMEDLDAMAAIYDGARAFMEEKGNPGQWGDGYPKTELLKEDILKGRSYVMEEDGKVIGTFVFIIGEDPTYQVIEKGSWRSDEVYGTIHRLASDGSKKGMAAACFDFCRGLNPYLRIDTHADNLPMQNAIARAGFEECGIIYVEDGSPRIAYDYLEK